MNCSSVCVARKLGWQLNRVGAINRLREGIERYFGIDAKASLEESFGAGDYSHRKEWVIGRLARLGSIVAIDICAYEVMSNHYHLVFCVDQLRAQQLPEREVAERWTRLYYLLIDA